MLQIYTILRHTCELLLAHMFFIQPSSARRKHFYVKFIVGFLVLCALSILLYKGYELIDNVFHSELSWTIGDVISGSQLLLYLYYILIDVFAIKALMLLCYDLKFEGLLFKSLAGHSADRIKGVIFYIIDANTIGKVSDIVGVSNLLIYIILRTIGVVTICFVIFFIFAKNWKQDDSYILRGKRFSSFIYLLLIMVIFVTNILVTMLFYAVGISLRYIGLIMELLFGLLILIVLSSIHINNKQKLEKQVFHQMLHDREKQFYISKENIELINRKYHDLKHQISALKLMPKTEQDKSIENLENSLSIYDSLINTDNEILNTIITEKSLYCKQKDIRFDFNYDSCNLDFIKTIDLYVLLGNALDNATEAVQKLDKNRQLMSLSIRKEKAMIFIETMNYHDNKITMHNGTPLTTKKNKEFHGFGLKSINSIAQKYKGIVKTDITETIFTLAIGIPIP